MCIEQFYQLGKVGQRSRQAIDLVDDNDVKLLGADSGGKFCEIVFTILDGHAKSTYPTSPAKPKRFVDDCRKLENNSHVPRSFQILIPRLLPALYEVRNNRG